MHSYTRSGSLAPSPGTPLACGVEDPPRDDDHGRWCGNRPMEPNDRRVVRWCRRPTRIQLSLDVVGLHIEYSDTPYTATAQT
jgi:hypothetical protein